MECVSSMVKFKEMADEINRNREENYRRTQSGSTQQQSGTHSTQKKGWTEEQFVKHILGVVTNARFRLADLKPAEIRNLAQLFGIDEEQVTKMDKKTYYEQVKKYFPNTKEATTSDKFIILKSLYEKSPNKS